MKLTHLPLEDDNVTRVRCEGPVTVRAGAGPEPLLQLLGPQCYRHRVILSMERADGIDTSGIVWLVGAINRFAEAGGRLILQAVPLTVQHMLDVLSLTGSFPIAANDPLARELAAQPPSGVLNGPSSGRIAAPPSGVLSGPVSGRLPAPGSGQ